MRLPTVLRVPRRWLTLGCASWVTVADEYGERRAIFCDHFAGHYGFHRAMTPAGHCEWPQL